MKIVVMVHVLEERVAELGFGIVVLWGVIQRMQHTSVVLAH